MNRAQCQKLANAAVSMDIGYIRRTLGRIGRKNAPNSSWKREAWKLNQWLKNMEQPPPYKIFTRGNSKLPFYSFSVLPVVTCPGAGDCALYCYSFKAWRYPSAFMRQLQNTILIKNQSYHIVDAFYGLKKDVHVRLYVDGDFDSLESVEFWFGLLKKRQDLKVYGYSKSWEEILKFKGEYPSNYRLNLSSGHNHTSATKKRVQKLPITRGEFIALPVEAGLQGKYQEKSYLQSLKQSAKNNGISKYFACPGKCGTCTKKDHACGSIRFNDVPILIGIH